MDKQHNHNNSSQMRALLCPDTHQNPSEGHGKESSSSDSTNQGAYSSSSPGPFRAENVSGAQAEGHDSVTKEGKEAKAGASSCCQLNDLKRLPQCHMKLGPLRFDETHTVLINVECFNQTMQICPQKGRELWHSDFVKMPCSQIAYQSGSRQISRWDVIFNKLKSLASKKEVRVKDVEEAIIKYNPKYKDQWSFDALCTFSKMIPETENYFKTLFPKIAALALKLPDLVKKAIPLLRKGRSATITLSQYQISCLLANAFFCTFPHRNTSRPNAEYSGYPSINFNSLFEKWSARKREKLRAIMHYFKVVTDEHTQPEGLVTFERRCLSNTDTSKWKSCKETLSKLHVTSEGQIEADGKGMLQVDFASSWIGGGVLGSGLLQEEILFLMNPELIVARLFTEKLEDNECLIITGSQQFSSYSGFGDTFEWAGPYQDNFERDEWARLKRQILAIDALKFRDRTEQYNRKHIFRELNKAYCGFKRYHEYEEPDIATGKWGCGAFNGDPQLKAVIQLMAAAKAKRGLAFFTFMDKHLEQNLEQIYHLMVTEKVTVEKLCKLLEDFCSQHHRSHVDLFEFIDKNIRASSRPSKSLL
ncbi:poly(ADP-ribose) glycohydrolase [Archocentrus centrarchus]|uniref:poly(ADP-ribose) glycohydrolase n=1 Tax=Archocentrus centrarchus TaxID=63155 RepID=UPI0011EA1462|nr:poly(ADP-ribose) glycohydrolase-like [Archocentrus centrarchus]